MAPSKVILLACGSFNPPTNMHLRMFELARDNLNRFGQYLVIGGIVSPVHEAYGKKELIPGIFRCEMLKLALKSSDWIQISDWECSQETWSKTRRVLQYHQNMLNSVLNDEKDFANNNEKNDLENGYDYSNWITNDIKNTEGPVQIKLLCGADLLESFATPGLWADEDIETIINQHGIVVVTRQGSDPRRFIYESDILTKYQHNIIIVTEWITNDVSSTKIRRALRRQESVKYLLEDSVIEFIKKHKLYGTTIKNDVEYVSNLNEKLTLPINSCTLTPSPSDTAMISASTSGNNIYLTLNSISDKALSSNRFFEADSGSKTFSTVGPTEISECSEMNFKNQQKGLQQSCQEISIISCEQNKDDKFGDQKKKVGFVKFQNLEVRELQVESHEEKTPKREVKCQKMSSTMHSKSITNQVRNSTSEVNKWECKINKENLRLKKSKSDALTSTDNGDVAFVKIHFTREGIKVISDKESIV